MKDDLKRNCDHIAENAAKINQQVKAFNEVLPPQVKVAFATKLNELTDQHTIFNELGIPERTGPARDRLQPLAGKSQDSKSTGDLV